MKIYRLQIYNYNCQSDPLIEINCKVGELNRKILEKKAEDYWRKNFPNIFKNFYWCNKGKSNSIFSDDDCCFSFLETIDVIEVMDEAMLMASE